MAGGGGGDSGEFGLQIAPMLDVMFVLLLFFMVSAGGQQKEAELGIKLPSTGKPRDNAPSVPVLIDINAAGQVYMNSQDVSTPEDRELLPLVARLKALVEADPKQVVVINPSLSAKNSRIVAVLSACTEAKVAHLAFGIPK
ncbi:hypothetical protein DB346_03245 [Verrucomicrobia bacterium LW23]|nr:hypothetical protein DB346_03245 [Verrucomicrobia bacterium LW23]